MEVKIGCDLVDVRKFKKSVQRGGRGFLDKIFSTHELSENTSIETLAGIFAAKEAAMKALGIRPGKWQGIEFIRQKGGKPRLKIAEPLEKKFYTHDLSIAHDGDYAMAFACFIKEG